MKAKKPIVYLAAALFTLAQATPAMAHGRHGGFHGAGPILGIAALGTALVVGTAEILSAPFQALAEAPQYAPPQAAYAPAPNYYAQAPVYAQPYPPQPVAYYQAPPVYYAAPQAYYGRPYYGR